MCLRGLCAYFLWHHIVVITCAAQTVRSAVTRLSMKKSMSLHQSDQRSHSVGFRVGEVALCPCPISSPALGTQFQNILQLQLQRQNQISGYENTVGYYSGLFKNKTTTTTTNFPPPIFFLNLAILKPFKTKRSHLDKWFCLFVCFC